MLKTKVKAGSITNLTDARYFAARGVNWIGFALSPDSDHYLDTAQMLAIKGWIDGVRIVGEFSLETPDTIRSAVRELGLDAVQFSMVTPETTVRELTDTVPLIKEIVLDYYHSDDDLREQCSAMPEGLSYLLLNLEKNRFTWQDLLAGVPFSLEAVREVCDRYPVLLALNFEPAEVKDILERLPVKGLHLMGGEEEKVGVKSFDDLDEILDLLEQE